ncbi:MAG: type III-B CRISPR module-associated protein Cmr5 [Desulfobacteraceae bacterium]|nr:type III-B CRISPR module-associated protein Cmr5 [Desulfobacteraceae bacterium]
MADRINTIGGIEQVRAKFAYECAEKVSKEDYRKKYKAYVKKIPAMIKTNGLAATFAFVLSKAKIKEKEKARTADAKAYHKIYEQTSAWLSQDQKNLIALSEKETDELVNKILKLETSSEYRAVTVEILAFFNWLRRFADGLIEGEDG